MIKDILLQIQRVLIYADELPAALLAEPLLHSTSEENNSSFGMKLTNLVPSMVVFSTGEIGTTTVGLTTRRRVVAESIPSSRPAPKSPKS